jgi:hypothetical protein
MNFIPLLTTKALDPIKVNVAHIVSYQRINQNATHIRLSDGTVLCVEDMPEQIDRAIHRPPVVPA